MKQGHQSVGYFNEIRPLLEERCYGCHQGGKAAGGLRIDDHASVLRGGESEEPAIVPHKADASELFP